MGWLDRLFGVKEPTVSYLDLPKRTDWPSQEDVDFARKYDLTYGEPVAGLLQRNSPQAQAHTEAYVANQDNRIDPQALRKSQLLPEQADQLYASWLASRRSPLASLGFDPRRMLFGTTGPLLNVAGTYTPKFDYMFLDPRYPEVPVHESVHRGFGLLRQVGKETPRDEETMTRATVLKHIGPMERGRGPVAARQVDQAQKAMQNQGYRELMEAYERDATEEFQRRNRKMGPR